MRMHDGSRHFGSLPETYDVASPQWYALRDHVASLAGAALRGFVTDDVTEAWIDFSFGAHSFSINNQLGDWLFFVEDPACPDAVMAAVLDHFERLLDPVLHSIRSIGPLARGTFRTVVFEARGRVTHRDFADLTSASRYADDAAWEVESGPVYAQVVDENFDVVYRAKR